jgi:hypothetical protein
LKPSVTGIRDSESWAFKPTVSAPNAMALRQNSFIDMTYWIIPTS